MDKTKPLIASKTFWGAVITGGSMLVAAIAGFEITGGEQVSLTEGFTMTGGVVGTILTIVGRYRAKKAIGSS